MKRDKSLLIAILVVVLTAAPVFAQVFRPNPSPTPQPDPAKILGVPQPAGTPVCGDGMVGTFGDARCLYACTDGRTTILAGTACTFPTVAATLPIATATPTPTPTRTPTPIPTATA